jgi:CRISPR-associated endonuclease Csn1
VKQKYVLNVSKSSKMKKILGLDIGVNSVGFALVEQNADTDSRIVKTGVRIVNEDPDFHGNFYQGNPASKNSARRTKRSIRRNNQRFKDRRNKLYKILKENRLFPANDLLLNISSEGLFFLRKSAVSERISPEEIGRIFIHLNQRRGYQSNRKAKKDEDETQYLQRVKELGEWTEDMTVGEFWYNFILFQDGRNELINPELVEWFEKKAKDEPGFRIRENIFPRKSYLNEFDLIWNIQRNYYPEILTGGPTCSKEQNKSSLFQKIRNEIIYYQRPLKSQKNLINDCSFEKHHKVAPKSSPFFQVFRIWQQINNLTVTSFSGEPVFPTEDCDINTELRLQLFNSLHNPNLLDKTHKALTLTKILKILEIPSRGYYINYDRIEGNKTYFVLYNALVKAGVADPERFLFCDPEIPDQKGGLFQLWHITYSLENEDDVINALSRNFDFDIDHATIIAQNVGYTSDYGSLSNRAIRKLLPEMQKGEGYYSACKTVGYENPEHEEREYFDEWMTPFNQNSLRNPVVEQVLNQVVNVVNTLSRTYGKPDEIRVELSRELKNNAKQRKLITDSNRNLRRYNDLIKARLMEEHGFKRVSSIDLLRYRLWEETGKRCLYSGKPINFSQVYNGETEIEHIIPKSRSFNDAANNKIISFVFENRKKDQLTAYDYLKSKGEWELQRYINDVNLLFQEGAHKLGSNTPQKIAKAKKENLLCKGEEIPDDFINRQLKDSQYIAKETIRALKKVVPKVTTTTGSVTDFLREKWELNQIMQEINIEKYRAIGRVERRTKKDLQGDDNEYEAISEWSKRLDHRHHAVDAIIIAFTRQNIIQKLNTLNKEFEKYRDLKQSALTFPQPMPHFRNEVRKALEGILISFKKPNSKVLTRKLNEKVNPPQLTWVPRGSLHEDTIFGRIKWYTKVKVDKKLTLDVIERISDSGLKEALLEHLLEHNGDLKSAWKEPFKYKDKEIKEVTIFENRYTKRIALTENITPAQIEKIIDKRAKKLVKERILFLGSIKSAFRDYRKDTIWLNKEKGIALLSVKVFDDGNLTAVRNGFAYTKGNHHALIYEDEKGNFVEKIVSFWEAVEIGLQNLKETGNIYPIIDRTDKPGLKFKFSLQINDLFVFDLNSEEIDFYNPDNRGMISKNLFRVQTISQRDYRFRHHLETTLDNDNLLFLRRLRSLNELKKVTKVKLSQAGELISIGE